LSGTGKIVPLIRTAGGGAPELDPLFSLWTPMDVHRPSHCNKRAFACLQQHLPELGTTRGLMRCAVAVSMHELIRVDPASVESQVDKLIVKIGRRLKSSHPRAVMAHAHDVLFEERGLKGNRADYYNPRNSYLSIVLRTGRGIPISLSLLYKCVVEPLGVSVHGINSPGHFLIGVDGSSSDDLVSGRTILDPFDAGRMLSRDEALQACRDVIGDAPMPDDALEPASHQDWLVRMIQNLCRVFERLEQRDDIAAMLEMRELVLKHARASG
jgi:regulator of sirC expression with transglutaminase-like and TPR domain